MVLIYPVVETKTTAMVGWTRSSRQDFMLRPERGPGPLSLGHGVKTLGRSLGASAEMHPEGFPAGLTADASTLNRYVTGID